MTKRKSIESVDVNQWIAAFCGVILGLLLEAIIGSYSWMETGPMIRFQSGVRLPVIGPLLGGILAYLFSGCLRPGPHAGTTGSVLQLPQK